MWSGMSQVGAHRDSTQCIQRPKFGAARAFGAADRERLQIKEGPLRLEAEARDLPTWMIAEE
jgi:hypothetical protein